MKGKTPLTVADMVIIFAALGIAGFSAFSAYAGPRNSSRVRIDGADRSWVFPLDAEETVYARGPLGTTVLRIHNNEAWVESSPCDNQSCVAMGKVSGAGNWAACLPNGVFLIVEGSESGGGNRPDTIAW